MATDENMKVEVAYALPEQQVILVVEVPKTCTIEEAILICGILEQFPDIDLAKNKVGIFSKLCLLDTPLRAGDRVEIYRPLLIDPKEIRRQRAKAQTKA